MTDVNDASLTGTAKASPVLLVVAWIWVSIPFLYGLYELALTGRKLFLK
ncbi:MFS transporter small subunit [Streptomyces silvisoli]